MKREGPRVYTYLTAESAVGVVLSGQRENGKKRKSGKSFFELFPFFKKKEETTPHNRPNH
jgi:hypothetical protein